MFFALDTFCPSSSIQLYAYIGCSQYCMQTLYSEPDPELWESNQTLIYKRGDETHHIWRSVGTNLCQATIFLIYCDLQLWQIFQLLKIPSMTVCHCTLFTVYLRVRLWERITDWGGRLERERCELSSVNEGWWMLRKLSLPTLSSGPLFSQEKIDNHFWINETYGFYL